MFLNPKSLTNSSVDLLIKFGTTIGIFLLTLLKVNGCKWSEWLWLIYIKLELFNSSIQSSLVGYFNHQPVLKAGPIAHGSVEKEKFFPAIFKKAWLKNLISVSNFALTLSMMGMYKISSIFKMFLSIEYLASFFLTPLW